MIDELSIYFDNPATDPLGHEAVAGKILCTEKAVEIHFKQKDRAFKNFRSKTIYLSYADVETARYEAKFFGPKTLVLTIRKSGNLSEFPGADVSRLELHVCKDSRSNAKKVAEYIGFRQSEAYLEESDRRLNETRDTAG